MDCYIIASTLEGGEGGVLSRNRDRAMEEEKEENKIALSLQRPWSKKF
jgi:hypothetical protein